MGTDIRFFIERKLRDTTNWTTVVEFMGFGRDRTLFSLLGEGSSTSGEDAVYPTRGIPTEITYCLVGGYYNPSWLTYDEFKNIGYVYRKVNPEDYAEFAWRGLRDVEEIMKVLMVGDHEVRCVYGFCC